MHTEYDDKEDKYYLVDDKGNRVEITADYVSQLESFPTQKNKRDIIR